MNCGTGVYNLCINQGATFERTFIWNVGTCCCDTVGSAPGPVDLTGYTAAMQIRAFVNPTAPLYYDATSHLTLGTTNGEINLYIPASDTETFTWWKGFYDLLLTDSSGNVTRLLQGEVMVAPGVTP